MKKLFSELICSFIMLTLLVLTASAQTDSFCPSMGDVDSDSKIAAADAHLILRASVGLEQFKKNSPGFMAADVDLSGDIAAADARLVLRMSVGLEKGFAHLPGILSAKLPDCTNSGMTQGTVCSLCGETLKKQESVPALGHKEKVIEGKAATCTATGLTDAAVCSLCGKTLIKQEIIPALGHKEKVIEGKAATCTATGLTDAAVCSLCGETLRTQERIPARGHTSVQSGALTPTFEKDGLTALVSCSVCGTVLEEQKVIPAVKNLIKEGSAPVAVSHEINADYPWIYCADMSGNGEVVYGSSNAGADKTASNLSLTVKGSGILAFDLYVSSEEDYDGLSKGTSAPFTVKSEKDFISGEKGWQTVQILITGKTEDEETSVYLAYTKDKSRAEGEDRAAIKNIEWISGEKTLEYSGTGGSVTAKTSGGSVVLSGGTVKCGETVTLKAVPEAGFAFLCLRDASGKAVSLVPECSFVMRSDCAYTAEFYKAGDAEAKIADILFADINDALASARSGDTVTVLCDCALSENAVVKQGVTLLIPCKDNDPGYNENGCNPDSSFGSGYTEGHLYRTLTVPQNVKLDVYGTLLINAETSRVVNGDPNGYGITGGYGQTMLEGAITVYPGGLLDCSGMVNGTGTTLIKQGASMYETYSVDLWRGGTVSILYEFLVNRNFPVYANSMNVHRSELVIESGAHYCGTIKLHHDDVNEVCRFPVVDNASGLFRLHENARIRRTVVWDASLTVKKNGAVSSGGYRDLYEFSGGAELESCTMAINGARLQTDNGGYFNVDGDADFTLTDGVYNVNKCFRFQPGFALTVNSGAQVNVNSGGGLMFVDNGYTALDALFWSTCSYPAGRNDSAMFIKDGAKLNVAANGALTGKVICDDLSDVALAQGAITEQSFKVTAAPGGTNKLEEYISNLYTVSLSLSEAKK